MTKIRQRLSHMTHAALLHKKGLGAFLVSLGTAVAFTVYFTLMLSGQAQEIGTNCPLAEHTHGAECYGTACTVTQSTASAASMPSTASATSLVDAEEIGEAGTQR